MTARNPFLLTAFLDWIVRGPESPVPARPPGRPGTLHQPPVREAPGDSNLFALLCRLTC